MKERPIIFSADMVRAILYGRKTQTRRIVKFPDHTYEPDDKWIKSVHQDGKGNWVAWSTDAPDLADFTKKAYPNGEGFKCPYGQSGDRLWVRETWQRIFDVAPPFDFDNPCHIEYKADTGNKYPGDWPDDSGDDEDCPRWSSPIHMPRDASRIILEITGVRVERVQNISEEDAIAEGVQGVGAFRELFVCLWDSINAKRGFSWESNPWVWVIEFKLQSIQRSSQFSE